MQPNLLPTIVARQQISQKSLRCLDVLGNHVVIGSHDLKIYIISNLEPGKNDSAIKEVATQFNPYSIHFVSQKEFLVGLQNGEILRIDVQGKVLNKFMNSGTIVSSLHSHQQLFLSGD